MFVDSQCITGAWSRYLFGSKLGILLLNFKQMPGYTFKNGKFLGKGYPRNPPTLVPTNNDDFF